MGDGSVSKRRSGMSILRGRGPCSRASFDRLWRIQRVVKWQAGATAGARRREKEGQAEPVRGAKEAVAVICECIYTVCVARRRRQWEEGQ